MSIIKDVLDGKWKDLQQNIEKQVADKLWTRIQDKKVDVLANINGVSKEKMQEIISLSKAPETPEVYT